MSWMSPLTVPMTTLPTGFGAGLGEERAEDRHAGLHRVGGEEDLRHEQDAVAEVDADDLHPGDQRVIEDPGGRPATAQQDVGPLDDLGRHAVVEVVVHLLGELVVGQRREIDLRVLVLRHRVSWVSGVPHRGTVPYDGTSWSENLAEKGPDVQSPVHRASLRRPRRARRWADRGDRGRRSGGSAQVDRRPPPRVADPRRGRRAGPRRHALSPRAAAGDARGPHPAEPVAGGARAPLAGGTRRRRRRGGRVVRARRQPRPLRRTGEQPEPGVGPRLDGVADPAARGVVRPGAAGVRRPDLRPALPRTPDGTVHRPDARHCRRAAGADARDPARRLHVGARGIRRGDLVGRGTGRRRLR